MLNTDQVTAICHHHMSDWRRIASDVNYGMENIGNQINNCRVFTYKSNQEMCGVEDGHAHRDTLWDVVDGDGDGGEHPRAHQRGLALGPHLQRRSRAGH